MTQPPSAIESPAPVAAVPLRDDLLLTVRLQRRHARAYRESGILPLEVIAAVVRALDRRQLELALGEPR